MIAFWILMRTYPSIASSSLKRGLNSAPFPKVQIGSKVCESQNDLWVLYEVGVDGPILKEKDYSGF